MSPERLLSLQREIEEKGLSDLRQLAPIGDLWFANGWAPDGIEYQIMDAFHQQGFKFDKHITHGYRRTHHEYFCSELGLRYHVDSSG